MPVLNCPETVTAVHRSFLEVGADVVETNTFRANRLTLAEYGLEKRTFELNQKAAVLARQVADAYSTTDQPRFVAGSMGPSGKLISTDDPQMSDISFDELVELYCEQAEAGVGRSRFNFDRNLAGHSGSEDCD